MFFLSEKNKTRGSISCQRCVYEHENKRMNEGINGGRKRGQGKRKSYTDTKWWMMMVVKKKEGYLSMKGMLLILLRLLKQKYHEHESRGRRCVRELKSERDAASSQGRISSDETTLVLILLPLLAFDFNPCCHENQRHDSEEQIGLLSCLKLLERNICYICRCHSCWGRKKSIGDWLLMTSSPDCHVKRCVLEFETRIIWKRRSWKWQK